MSPTACEWSPNAMATSPLQRRIFFAALILAAWIAGLPSRSVWAAPSAPEAVVMYRNAAALQGRGLFDLAIEEWESLEKKFPADPLVAQAKFYRGVCLFQLRKVEPAIAAFRSVVEKHPQSEVAEQAYANLGLAQYTRGQSEADDQLLDTAVKTFDQQFKRFPNGKFAPQAQFYRAEALYLRGKPDQAASGYRKFLTSAPQDHPLQPQAMYGLGVALDDAGDATGAASALREFLKRYPKHELQAEIRLRLGDALLAEGKRQEAAEQFAAAADAPDFAQADEALERQAVCYYQLKDYKRAAELYATLADRFSDSPLAAAATVSAGKCYYLAGEETPAEVWLRRAMSARNNNASDAAHWLARTLIGAGRAKEAVDLVTPLILRAEDNAPPLTPPQNGEGNSLIVALKMDRADALMELPEGRREAAAAYSELARDAAGDPLSAKAAYLAAHTYLTLGDYKAARDQAVGFEKYFSTSDLLADARSVAAEANLQLGQAGDAARQFAALARDYPNHPQRTAWQLRAAFCHVSGKQWHEAIAILEPLVRDERDPAMGARARVLLGKSYLATGKSTSAVNVLKTAADVSSNPQQDEALALLARAETAAAQPKEAAATWGRLLQLHPRSPFATQARLSRATIRHEMGDDRGATEDLAIYLKTNPPEPARSDALLLQGTSQARLKNFDDAIGTYKSIEQSNPQYSALDRVSYELAWAYEGRGRSDEAVAAFARTAHQHPESPLAGESWYRVADAEFAKGKFDEAKTNYQKAYKSQAANADVREKAAHKLGWLEFRQGENAAAELAFAAQLQEFPSGPLAVDARLMLGEALFQQAKYEEAIEAMTAALGEKPSSEALAATALVHAAQAAGQVGQWERSIELVDRFLREYPKSQLRNEAVYEKAWALYNTGKRDAALRMFEDVAESTTSVVGARARFMVGEIQFANKDYDGAVRTFFKVAYGYGEQEAPEAFHHWQSEAMFEAGRCLEESKRLQSAQKVYEDLLERYPASDKATHARVRLRELSARIPSQPPR